jgi:hypothetical protein
MLGPAPVLAGDDNSPLYIKKNLVSNLARIASTQDPKLVNAWGISFFPGGPFWISECPSGKKLNRMNHL